jgi:hypothetical protein
MERMGRLSAGRRRYGSDDHQNTFGDQEKMAARDSDDDFEPNASGDEEDDDEDMSSADDDDDPLVVRYRARAAQTAEMVQAFEEREEDAGDDEQEEIDNSMWGTCVADVPRCVALCGFTPLEFLELFGELEDRLEEHVGRGKRSKITKHDRLLMLLVFLKHYESNTRLAQTFGLSKSHVQKCVSSTAETVLPTLWRCYIETLDIDDPERYDEFPGVVAMMDVTVQPIWVPEGAYDERKRYFSGKHKMYVMKSQCLHDRRGRVLSVVTGIAGAVHDVSIAQRSIAEIRRVVRPMEPRDNDEDPVDVEADVDDQEDGRLLMVDSGYQGLQHLLPCVLPYKKRPNRALTAPQKQHNRRMARRRVLVENYYGRLKRRYRIMTDKYRGERDGYEMYFKLCVALTNFHVIKHPLRTL